MKRIIVYVTGALTVLLIAVGAVTLEWLLESPDGLQWLFRTVSRQGGVTVSARAVRGGAGSSLQLEGLQLRWGSGVLAVEQMRLRWQPLLIPFGTVAVEELTLAGVRIQDDAPSSGRISWPHLSGLPTRLNGRIDRLTLTDLAYRAGQTQPVTIPRAVAELSWRGGELTLSRLELRTSAGVVSGTATAGFVQPLLRSTLSFEPPQPVLDASRFELRTHLVSGTDPKLLAGELKVAALKGKEPRFTLSGSAAITALGVTLNDVSLAETGRRGKVTGNAGYLVSGITRLRLRCDGLDLSREAGRNMLLSGTAVGEGTPENYAGQFDLSGVGDTWLKSRMKGRFRGTGTDLDLAGVDATLLNGSLRGSARVDWRTGLKVSGTLQGRGLDPAPLAPGWRGAVNFDLNGQAGWQGGRLAGAELTGKLVESRLHDRELSGEIRTRLKGDNLRIDRLFLTGSGFDVRADGNFRQRLNISVHSTDLSHILPGASGQVELSGWGRYSGGEYQGAFRGQGVELAAEGTRIRKAVLDGTLSGRGGVTDVTADVTSELTGVMYDRFEVSSASLHASGSIGRHQITVAASSSGVDMAGTLSGGYTNAHWKGTLVTFSGHDRIGPWRLAADPVAMSISATEFSIAPLVIIGRPDEKLELAGRMVLAGQLGSVRARWNGINLARIGQLLPELQLSGNSSGSLLVDRTARALVMSGKARAAGSAVLGEQRITLQNADLDVTAGERGITALMNVKTAEGIVVTGQFTSAEPVSRTLPSRGELQASWQGLDTTLAKRWLPPELELAGHFSGDISGKLLPDRRFDLSGSVRLEDGGGRWRSDGTEFALTFKNAAGTWGWKGDALDAALTLSLQERGEVRGQVRLPLEARLGASLEADGPVSGSLAGTFHEKGLLAGMFTGVIQESKGEVTADLKLAGSWKTPTVTGSLLIDKAGAYVPGAGITLREVRLAASLDSGSVRITSFRMMSGSGDLTGSASVDFDGLRLLRYNGSLAGTSFQAVYLPELHVLVSPELTFEGDRDRLVVRGDIRIPELKYLAGNSREMVKPSRDVEIAGKAAARKQRSGPQLDFQALLTLGDKVYVKAEGLDSRLTGAIELQILQPGNITGTGEIKVAKGGIFTFYGTTLNIERGRAIFNGGVISRPIIDILALRRIDEVKAGVTVTGTPDSPFITLYSEPALPEVEILAYVVLGQKLSESSDQLALLTTAASMLTSSRDATPMTEQIKQQLGLDTFGLTTGKEAQTGYKAIEPSLTTSSAVATEGDTLAQSMFQVGKYLTPRLYLSYGRSIFSPEQQIQARYSFTKRLEVESKFSTAASGGDVFYRFEFD